MGYTGTIAIVLIIGFIIGLISYYLYKQKHRNTNESKGHYFSNVGYIDTDEKKIPIPVTPIIDNNDAELMKEKETLQNV